MIVGRTVAMPLALAVTVVSGIFGFGKAAQRADDVERRATVSETRQAELERNVQSLREAYGMRLTTLEVNLSNMIQTLGRIEGKVDRNNAPNEVRR
jgi:hypothetical protein